MNHNSEKTATQHKKYTPISEGLGLNHFKDGLPYEPKSKRSQNNTKPVVNFNFPKPQRNANLLKDDRLELEKNSASDTSAVEVFGSMQNAHFLRRFFAYGIDLAITISFFTLITWASFSLNSYDIKALLKEEFGIQMILPLFLLYFVIYMGYFMIQELTWRRTIGKKLMKISIASHSGLSTMARVFLFFLSSIPFGLGLGWYFFDSKRRCWHDLVTDSEVILHS